VVHAGVPGKTAMAISGHKTRSVFDRFSIVSTEDITNAMRRVELASAKALPAISEIIGEKADSSIA
jgi:hypothetical protein